MTEPVQEKERAAFETWVKHELLDGGLINLEREEGGEYSHSAANLAWEVWQAAYASEGRREPQGFKCPDCGTTYQESPAECLACGRVIEGRRVTTLEEDSDG